MNPSRTPKTDGAGEAATATAIAADGAEPRRYRSTRREQQAAQTRHDVLMAAMRLFNTTGWTGTTMAAVAAEAGVAVETVYSVGNKKQLLRQAMDVAVVGDTDPVPLADRPQYSRMGEGSLEQRVRAGIAIQGATHERGAGIWMALREAAEGDAEVAQWCREIEATRHVETARSIALMVNRPLADPELDLIWALFSAEVYVKLVRDRGWSHEQYLEHLVTAGVKLIR